MSKIYTATELINICNMLEGEYIGTFELNFKDKVHGLQTRLSNLIGINFALYGEEFRQRLFNDIKSMMIMDQNGCLQFNW